MSGSKFMRWLRVVLVSDWVLWLMVGAVLVAWLMQRLVVLWIYLVAAPELTESEARIDQISAHAFAALFAAFLYGVCRVVEFHPVLNKPYGRWLATTPWKYPEPLPLGPIRLVWQDAVVLLMLIGLALLPPWRDLSIGVGIPFVFLMGYCLALGRALYQLEAYWACGLYTLLAGCGLLAISYPPAFVLVAVALIGVSHLAIGALRDFPYTAARRKALGLSSSELPAEAEVNWTIAPLTDEGSLDFLNPRQATLVCLLAGWLMFGVATLPIPDVTVRGLLMAYCGVCMLAIFGRLFRFVSYRLPPISIPGRIATGRYRIPGYDQVFIAPLAATAVAFLLPILLLALGVWPPPAIAVSTSVVVWLTLALPPSFKEWYYTGHFRMLPPAVSQQKQPRVRAGN